MTVQTVDVRPNGGFVGVIGVIAFSHTDRRCRRKLLHADFFRGSGLNEQAFVRHWRTSGGGGRNPMTCRKRVSAPRLPVVGAIGLPQCRPTLPGGEGIAFALITGGTASCQKDNAYAHA
jgi:hypothetical protein